MNNIFYVYSPYLQHHGILGMKWGIRRYQKPNGSLTMAGKRRVKKAMKQRDVVMTTLDERDRNKEMKKFRNMTNKLYSGETRELIKQIEKDEQIRSMTQVREDRDKILKGMQYAERALQVAGKAIEVAGVASSAYATAKSASAIVRQLNDESTFINRVELSPKSGQLNIGMKKENNQNKNNQNGQSNVAEDIKKVVESKNSKNNETSSGKAAYTSPTIKVDKKTPYSFDPMTGKPVIGKSQPKGRKQQSSFSRAYVEAKSWDHDKAKLNEIRSRTPLSSDPVIKASEAGKKEAKKLEKYTPVSIKGFNATGVVLGNYADFTVNQREAVKNARRKE